MLVSREDIVELAHLLQIGEFLDCCHIVKVIAHSDADAVVHVSFRSVVVRALVGIGQIDLHHRQIPSATVRSLKDCPEVILMGRRSLYHIQSLGACVTVGKLRCFESIILGLERVVGIIASHCSLQAAQHIRTVVGRNGHGYDDVLGSTAVHQRNLNLVLSNNLVGRNGDGERAILLVLGHGAHLDVAAACYRAGEVLFPIISVQIVGDHHILGLAGIELQLLRLHAQGHVGFSHAINLKLPDAERTVHVRHKFHVACVHRGYIVGLY